MVRVVKAGRSETAKTEADADVRATVEELLAGVAARGDEAVRHYSRTFDGWDPETFRLSRDEIDACVAAVPDDERSKILSGNVAEFFHLLPLG